MSNWPITSATRCETLGVSSGEGTSVTSGSGTKGSWATVGTAGFDYNGIVIQIAGGTNATDRFRFDVAINPGANKIIVPDLYFELSSGVQAIIDVPLAIAVKAGATIEVRAQAASGSRALNVAVTGYAGGFPLDPGHSCAVSCTDFTGTDPTNTITLAGTSPTAWAEICASIPGDISALYMSLTDVGGSVSARAHVLIDIAIGASGSERTILSPFFQYGASSLNGLQPFGPMPLHLPQGTRLAARATANGSPANPLAVSFMGLAA
jgi:hypothetical protein